MPFIPVKRLDILRKWGLIDDEVQFVYLTGIYGYLYHIENLEDENIAPVEIEFNDRKLEMETNRILYTSECLISPQEVYIYMIRWNALETQTVYILKIERKGIDTIMKGIQNQDDIAKECFYVAPTDIIDRYIDFWSRVFVKDVEQPCGKCGFWIHETFPGQGESPECSICFISKISEVLKSVQSET